VSDLCSRKKGRGGLAGREAFLPHRDAPAGFVRRRGAVVRWRSELPNAGAMAAAEKLGLLGFRAVEAAAAGWGCEGSGLHLK
jgi:hypothetical protein